jgi:glycosyltransferase involved in cell wall biosynthesis
MRVAHVCADPGVPVFGSKGASVHVQEVARALLRSGADVQLLATRIGGPAPAGLDAAGLHALPPAPKGEPAEREARALAANGALQDTLRGLGPLDCVYERYSLHSHAAMEHARDAGIPGVLEVNAPLIDEQERHRALADRAAAEGVARRAFDAASVIVAVSEGVRVWLERWPQARGKVHVIGNGVDPGRFRARQRTTRTFTVGFLGTLKPWHGLDTLLGAFARLHAWRPDAQMLIVGDGPEAPRIAATLERLGLTGAVRLTGAVDPAEVPRHLAEMDVAVAPYPDLRPFYFSPLKIVEYAAAGLPVICSDVGGLDRLVEHGRTGLLCAPDDEVALADALFTLAADPRRRAQMGRLGRRAVLRDHTWDAVVARVLELARLPAAASIATPSAG